LVVAWRFRWMNGWAVPRVAHELNFTCSPHPYHFVNRVM
jgi:hypothetical protein